MSGTHTPIAFKLTIMLFKFLDERKWFYFLKRELPRFYSGIFYILGSDLGPEMNKYLFSKYPARQNCNKAIGNVKKGH